jgi:hypothetical protein
VKITVTISRDEGQWEATASGVIGGFTHLRLATLKRSIEEIVPRMFPDRPDEPLEIVYTYALPARIQQLA